MKQLSELLDTFRIQAADIMETMQEINRIASVQLTTSHSKRIEIIQRIVADHYQLPVEIMHSKVRARSYVRARHVAIYLSRELTNFSLEDIATAFRPGLDHGTVSYAIESVADIMTTETGFAEVIAKLRAKSAQGIEDISMPLFAYVKRKPAATTP